MRCNMMQGPLSPFSRSSKWPDCVLELTGSNVDGFCMAVGSCEKMDFLTCLFLCVARILIPQSGSFCYVQVEKYTLKGIPEEQP